jgi:hypothetical protein
MSGPQGYTKKQSRFARQLTKNSDLAQTSALDTVSNTTEIVELSIVAQKVTVSTTNGMAGTVAFSMDGENYTTPVAISSTPLTYSTNLVTLVKIVCTSGAGTAVVAAV